MSDDERDRGSIEWLWREASSHRDKHGSLDVPQLLQEADAAGVKVGWREIVWLIEKAGPRTGGMWTPAVFVIEFLRAYLAGRGAERLVDPAVTAPSLLLALADGDIAQSAVGLTPSPRLPMSLSGLATGGRISWREGWRVAPVDTEALALGSPDLIVSAPPANIDRESASYGTGGGRVVLNDHADMHVLMTALDLAEGGEALFIVPNAFLFRGGLQTARPVLSQVGLHVHAYVELVNAFRATGAPFGLIALSKRPAATTWVGQLSPHVDVAQLAKNMRARKSGGAPELGRLIEWSAFQSFGHLAGAERLETLLKRSGFPSVPLRKLLRDEPTWPVRGTRESIEPQPNTVYLPTFLTATVHPEVDAENLKASGYVTLPLDSEKALSEYVALVLNSELGRTVRAQVSGGATMPSLRRQSLGAMSLPLPGLDVQRKVLSVRQRVRDMRGELDGIERALSDRPRETDRLQRRLRAVGQLDPFKAWLEMLPFPLASIAWRYRVDAGVNDKVDHLLRFFEASAMFFATVLLSAFDAEEELRSLERPRWGDKQGELRLTYASFGTWTKLGAAMAGSARRLLASTENEGALAVQMRTALAVTGPEFLRLVTGKEVWKLLDALTQERNDDAHGGIKGASERERKLHRLEGELTRLRGLTSDAMQEVRLVLPREGAYRKGVNQYRKALDVSGYVEAFPSIALESTQQLDAEELHLVDVSDEPVKGGLQLVPLVRLRPAPSSEETACYFYSRLNGERAEYVSHHFERESRIPVTDEDLLAFFERLDPADRT